MTEPTSAPPDTAIYRVETFSRAGVRLERLMPEVPGHQAIWQGRGRVRVEGAEIDYGFSLPHHLVTTPDEAFAAAPEVAQVAGEKAAEEFRRARTRALLSGLVPQTRQRFNPRIQPPPVGG